MSSIKFSVSGKEVGIYFGWISYDSITTDKNRSLMIDEENKVTDLGLAKIIYSGYVNNCVNKNIEVELSMDDFARAISKLTTPEEIEKVTAIITAWKDSQPMTEAVAANEEKKSQSIGENNATGLEPNA